MTSFKVWAPHAAQMEVVIGETRHPMAEVTPNQATPGWWRAEVPGAEADTRYRFSRDGGPPRPDPRSPAQPEGIDGPSQLVDHGAFVWHDQDWQGIGLDRSVIYELHLGTFTSEGTCEAAIRRLGYLADLGVSAIELLPVAQASGERGWGYDGVDLWAPHSAYGGPVGLKRLVDAAHTRGLGVILDVVYNHLGPAGNYLAEYGPYFTDRYRTPWGTAVNFDDRGSDEVRQFVIDNACMWLRDYHLDGLRLDAVHAIFDQSPVPILAELSQAVADLTEGTGRRAVLIAESDLNDPAVVTPRAAGGLGIDASWSDDFHHALHAVLTGETAGYYADFGSLGGLAKALRQVYVYGGEYSPFRNRRHGRAIPGDLDGTHFLGYSQNHDQIGNRARGERLCQLVSPGRAWMAAALTILGPWVPMLFQGEEWGASTPWQYFTDHQDRALGEAVSHGRRGEFAAFGWAPSEVPDPQALSTFSASKLDWDELDESGHAEMLEWYRSLLAIRRDHPLLTGASRSEIAVDFDEEEGWLSYHHQGLAVACNLGDRPHLFAPALEVLLSSQEDLDPDHPELKADAVAVLSVG